MQRFEKRLVGVPLFMAALAFAPIAEGYGGSSNYVFGTSTCSAPLKGVKVTIEITEDLTPGPTTPASCDGFAFQLNANSLNSASAFEWQQYILGVDSPGASINGAYNNWTAPNNLANQPTVLVAGPAVTLKTLSAYTIPAGTTLTITLGYTGDDVSQVTYGITGATPITQTLMDPGAIAPIYELQVDLGGPGDSCLASFLSGSGTITYQSSTPFISQPSIPTCANGTVTAESSNSAYGVPVGSGTEFVQSFWVGPHTELANGASVNSLNLAVSSNEPVGTGNQWSSYFASVPAGTGIFTEEGAARHVWSWFDTSGTPTSIYTDGDNAISVAVQGQTGGLYDRMYELTSAGKVWYNASPQGPLGTWTSWTSYGGGVIVPGVNTSTARMSIMGPNDSPWVVNGDANCDSNGNSHLYKWTGSWTQEPGCMKAFAEEDTCLLGASYDAAGNSYLWTSPNTTISWTKRALLVSGGGVESIAAIGTSSALTAYIADNAGNLLQWSGSCTTTGTVSTVISANSYWDVSAVTRDWAGGTGTQNVYFVNNNRAVGGMELWQY
jgi:hypothetical protein